MIYYYDGFDVKDLNRIFIKLIIFQEKLRENAVYTEGKFLKSRCNENAIFKF